MEVAHDQCEYGFSRPTAVPRQTGAASGNACRASVRKGERRPDLARVRETRGCVTCTIVRVFDRQAQAVCEAPRHADIDFMTEVGISPVGMETVHPDPETRFGHAVAGGRAPVAQANARRRGEYIGAPGEELSAAKWRLKSVLTGV